MKAKWPQNYGIDSRQSLVACRGFRVAGCQDVVDAGWKSHLQILIDNFTFQLAVKYSNQAKFIIKRTDRDRKIWS